MWMSGYPLISCKRTTGQCSYRLELFLQSILKLYVIMTISRFTIILWICHFIGGVVSKLGEDVLLESKVRCLDKSFRYRKRPDSNMKIMTELAIMSIDSISSAKMELSADVYLIHEWIDRRCSWSAIPGK